jgi:hypothetical protein
MVLVKDISLVGKKIDCPKCKYRFQVEKPKTSKANGQAKRFRDQDPDAEDADAVDELEEVEEEEDAPPARSKSKATAAAKEQVKSKPQVKKRVKDEEDDEVEDDEPGEDRPAKKSARRDKDDEEEGKPRSKGRAKAEEAEGDDEAGEDEEEGDGKKKKKKKGGSNKLVIGLALAGIGVVVLALAAFLMSSPSTKGTSGPGPKGQTAGPGPAPPPPPVNPGGVAETKKPEATPVTPIKTPTPTRTPEGPAIPITEVELAALTNLLPNDTEHVLHFAGREFFDLNHPLRDATFQRGAADTGVLDDANLRKHLGFSVLAIDEVLRAQRFTAPAWSYTVLHFNQPLNEADLKTALRLKPAGSAVKNQVYYQISEPNPWFEPLAQLSLGVPAQVHQLDNRPLNRPVFVRLHGPRTLIIADEAPLQALLKADGAFPILANRPGTPGQDPAQPPMPPQSPLEALYGTAWNGSEDAPGYGKLRFEFSPSNILKVIDAQGSQNGSWSLDGQKMNMFVSGRNANFNGVINGKTMSGEAEAGKKPWKWTVTQETAGAAGPIGSVDLRAEMYLTIKPALKALLDRMETKAPDQRLLVSSATDMEAARVNTNLPEFKDRMPRRPRQMWDVSLLLTEHRPHLRLLGTALLHKQGRIYSYRNELECLQEADAKESQKELVERVAPQVARFLDRLLGLKVELPKLETAAADNQPPGPQGGGPLRPGGLRPGGGPLRPGGGPGGGQVPPGPMPPSTKAPTKADPTTSHIDVTLQEKMLEFELNLVLDQQALASVYVVTALAAGALRAEMDLAASSPARHTLARAGKELGVKGLSKAGVPPGVWPPGAFPRIGGTRLDREPLQRVSWMAGLLPYLGQDGLYSRIAFKDSWRDPSNWLAARTLVPQFLDPTFPDSSRTTSVPGVPVDLAATNYVGIAGVGLDAASYRPDDPATLHKRGVLGYDQSYSVAAVQKGRGTANTILMIEVPHDGLTGVSPWIAGGGSTLRGVPEQNSIAPFVLTKDRYGKVIQHQGKRGTYALMTDGTVRFITESVADDVFKAMCTVNGPAPEKFDPDRDPNTPRVADADSKAPLKASTAVPNEKKAPPPPPPPAVKEENKTPPPTPTPPQETKEEKKSTPTPSEFKAAPKGLKLEVPKGPLKKTSWQPGTELPRGSQIAATVRAVRANIRHQPRSDSLIAS